MASLGNRKQRSGCDSQATGFEEWERISEEAMQIVRDMRTFYCSRLAFLYIFSLR